MAPSHAARTPPRSSTCETRAKAANQKSGLLLAPSTDPVTPSTSCGSSTIKTSQNSHGAARADFEFMSAGYFRFIVISSLLSCLVFLRHLLQCFPPFGVHFRPAAHCMLSESWLFIGWLGSTLYAVSCLGRFPTAIKRRRNRTREATMDNGVQNDRKT